MRAALQLDLFDPPVTATTPFILPSAGEIERHAREVLSLAGYSSLASRISVEWRRRLRSSAGLAYTSKMLIVLNPRLAEFGPAEIERTLKHELAHLLAAHWGGRRVAAHGKEWRRACITLGIPDEKRTHTLPLPRRTLARPHVYRCPRCTQEVRRVKPFRCRAACYVCCREFSRGRYDERFRLNKVRPSGSDKT